MRCYFATILLLILYVQLRAQEYKFRRINTEDGLPSDHVSAVIQDRDGFIWIGTDEGLARYDGFQFEQIKDTAQGDFNVNFLMQSVDGLIWIATNEDGLIVYDPVTSLFQYHRHDPLDSKSIAGNRVRCITEDEKGNIWLGFDNEAGISVLDRKRGSFKNYDPFKDYPYELLGKYYQSVHGILTDPKNPNRMWIGGSLGLFSFDIEEEVFELHRNIQHLPNLNRDASIRHFAWQNENEIRAGYFGLGGSGYSGTAVFNTIKREWQNIRKGTEIPARILGFARKSINEYWVAARRSGFGTMNINDNSFNLFETDPEKPQTVQGGTISEVYKARQGEIWVSGNQGVSYYDSDADYLTYFPLEFHSSQYGRVIASATDGDRVYLSGIDAKGIWEYHPGSGEVKLYPLEFGESANIETIAVGKDVIYALGVRKLYRLSKGDNYLVELPVYVDSLVKGTIPGFAAIKIVNDSLLLLGTRLHGALEYDLNTFQLKGYFDKDGNPLTGLENLAIARLSEDEFMLSNARSEGGEVTFSRFNVNSKKVEKLHFSGDSRDNSTWMTQIVSGKNNDLWFGTDDGVRLIRNDEEIILNEKTSNLSGSVIQELDLDEKGNLWVRHNLGISWIHGETLRIRNFDRSDGFADIYSLKNIGANQMVVGVDGGFKLVDTKKLLFEDGAPKTFLTRFSVLDQEELFDTHINYVKEITLRPDQNFFSFLFTSPEFTRSDRLQFTYLLKGFDNDWKTAGKERKANYTNVSPGRYTFQVKSKMGEGPWGEVKSISLIVLSPFWSQWWFITLIVLFSVLLIFAFYRYQLSQALKTEKVKSTLEKKVAEVQMTALRAQMNPHFLFNALNSINSYIIKNKVREATEYIAKFSTLIRVVLNNSQNHLVSLGEELDALKIYIELEALRFDHQFSFHFDVPQDVEVQHLEIPPMLIQPYVENAIWHGLMHKIGERRLTIKIIKRGKEIEIQITDNGIGREAAMRLKSKNATKNKSFGMKISADRLQVMKEVYGKNVLVNVEDLHDNENLPIGTTVRLTIPIYE